MKFKIIFNRHFMAFRIESKLRALRRNNFYLLFIYCFNKWSVAGKIKSLVIWDRRLIINRHFDGIGSLLAFNMRECVCVCVCACVYVCMYIQYYNYVINLIYVYICMYVHIYKIWNADNKILNSRQQLCVGLWCKPVHIIFSVCMQKRTHEEKYVRS